MASRAVFKKLLVKQPEAPEPQPRKKRKRRQGPTGKPGSHGKLPAPGPAPAAAKPRYFAATADETPSKKPKKAVPIDEDEVDSVEASSQSEPSNESLKDEHDRDVENNFEELVEHSDDEEDENEQSDNSEEVDDDEAYEGSSAPGVISMDDDEEDQQQPAQGVSNTHLRTASSFSFAGKVIPFEKNTAAAGRSDASSSILLFYRNEKFYFHGALELRVFQGAVSVFGFTMAPSNPPEYLPVLSPFSSNAMSVECVGHSPVPKPETAKKTKLVGEDLEINKILLKHQSSISWYKVVAIAVVRAVKTAHLSSAELFLFPRNKQKQQAAISSAGPDTEDSGSEVAARPLVRAVSKFYDPLKLTSTHVIRYDDGAYQLTTIPESWLSLKQQILLSTSGKHAGGAVLVCGKKNVGKSSLGRYLVNSLLTKVPAVAFLECDVGQTELTPPGMVSLSLVTKPLLGQPFTNVNSPAATLCKAQFIGDTSPKNNPEQFVHCVYSLYDHYLDHVRNTSETPVPLVINTHGWIQGTGYIDAELSKPDPRRSEEAHQSAGPSRDRGIPTTPAFCPGCVVTCAAVRLFSIFRLSLTSEQKRQYQMMAYFGMGDKLFGLKTTYRVPMGALRFHFMDGEVLPSQSLHALNASVVALVADTTPTVVFNHGRNTMSRYLPQYLLSAPKPGYSECIGLGVIKSIDIEERVLCIVTPVAPDRLRNVNVIMKASLELPPLILLKDVTINTPYLTADSITSIGTGATQMKSRSNIMRHRFDSRVNQ